MGVLFHERTMLASEIDSSPVVVDGLVYFASGSTDSDPAVVVVYASRFAATERTLDASRTGPKHPFQIGPIDVVVSGAIVSVLRQ